MSCIVSFPVQIRDLIKAQKQCIGKHVCIKVTTPSFPITSSIANVSLTKFINISSVTFQASGENFFTITTETTGLFTYPDILVTKLLAVAGCAFVVQPIDPGQPFYVNYGAGSITWRSAAFILDKVKIYRPLWDGIQ